MEMRDFLAEYHPLVLKEFEMYERRDRLPATGSYVRTYRGFNGLASGTPLKVIGYRDDDRIILKDALDFGYTVGKDDWWRQVYMVEESK